ncbi:GntR family transcriptional regulator [Mycetocola spongiae]|uniref:GntR family transcriptional regulator n=1 Tax=Mycetocola spongiae TaxID=2859226 RepID=UPI001CF14A53|nr:GntR family transcriptional regulator [Mycetocola spongiae]
MLPSTSDRVLQTLRTRILTLDLPPGEPLSERALEATLGASRTPIRAALFRLEAEGLVRRGSRAWSVAPLSEDEVHHLSGFREAVECAAVRLVAERVAAGEDLGAELDALEAELGEDIPAPAAIVRRGDRFHLSLAALGGNPFLLDALETALTRLSRVRWVEAQTATPTQSAREHREIMAAVRRGDAAAAAGLVADHSRGVRERVLAGLGGERSRGLRVERG